MDTNTFNIKTQDGIVTSDSPSFFDPKIQPPPRGVDMFVMTSGGICLKSVWRDNMGFLAWYPLPKAPPWLKERLRLAYFKPKDQDDPTELPSRDDPGLPDSGDSATGCPEDLRGE